MTGLLTFFIIFSIFSCSIDDCPAEINKLPMYGNQKKCDWQIQADHIFIQEVDNIFPGRDSAAKYYINKAWNYFYLNQLDTSMMRFNQAWLLDSLNPDIYWGFGNILGKQLKYGESLIYFEKSIKLNPKNPIVWECASTSLGQLFFQTKDIKLLEKCIYYLKKSLSLEPKNARVLSQLTSAYTYFMQNDSALKYLELTDKIDSNMVNPEVRRKLTIKK